MAELPGDSSGLTTSDERLLSAVVHFFGLLAALVVWALQKDRSKCVRFQSVQAIAFDFAAVIIGSLCSVGLIGVLLLGLVGGSYGLLTSSSPEDIAPLFLMVPVLFPLSTFGCVLPYSLMIFLLRVIAAGSVLTGHDFRYPILGKMVEHFLEDNK
jgi:uncharacterized Tic20 family protein